MGPYGEVSNAATTTSVVHPTMTMPLFARFPFSIPLQTLNPTKPNARLRSPWPVFLLIQIGSISSLKVAWRKDRLLDSAIERDKRWHLCAHVVREVLNEPGHAIPLRYLEKRRERLHLPVKVKTFLSRYPNLFDLYPDRIKPKTEPVPFLRPSPRLRSFLALEASLRTRQEPLVLAKLCKLLMMSRDRVIPAEKLLNVKRDFGFPDDLLTSLVPKYPHLLRLILS
ncbi:protein WHAT'S THIS FACTOR 9, mitochondrial-like [Phoenix dactylifera]|uniref:Protein WHAT'S THIS FACTOR 9, mitochondrial-like n=1 Tax=Phoenix dactylifera TaxID=42345 RepID=A0A8B8ZC66_PHODC|nr:protein WHAT'S THIS FACTOR 9, mitochondrial-like [Phoenix dactylifera]